MNTLLKQIANILLIRILAIFKIIAKISGLIKNNRRNKNLLYLVYPITYIIFIFFTRFIFTRLPRDLFVPFTLYKLFLTLFIITMLGLRLYFLLRKASYIKKNDVTENPYLKNKIILFCLSKLLAIARFFKKSWLAFYAFLCTKIPKIQFGFVYIARFMDKNDTDNKRLLLILFFDVVPKIIMITIFLIEVLVYKQICYFYKLLWLFVLPLILLALEKLLINIL
jgi:hypothetical protein